MITDERTAIVTLTRRGQDLALKIKGSLKEVNIYSPQKLMNQGEGICHYNTSLKELTVKLFKEYKNIIYIMALGIVVRVIAPCLKDKRVDPAIVTIDESAQHVISTLSGHLGGANALTDRIAKILKTKAVITTATDCQGKLAIDLLARKLNCTMEPFKNLKFANATIVNEQPLSIFTDYKIDLTKTANISIYPLAALGSKLVQTGFPVIISNSNIIIDQDYLQLIPSNIIIGIGCRRGVAAKEIKFAIDETLKSLNLKEKSIKKLATIDLKKDETGLIEYAAEKFLEIDFIKRYEIKNTNLKISRSEFVQKMIGVAGVCEPAALLSSKKGKLILAKTIYNRVTVAVVEEEIIIEY